MKYAFEKGSLSTAIIRITATSEGWLIQKWANIGFCSIILKDYKHVPRDTNLYSCAPNTLCTWGDLLGHFLDYIPIKQVIVAPYWNSNKQKES